MAYDYAAKLTELFEAVEPQFRAAQVAKYRETANNQLAAWLQRLEGPEPDRKQRYYVDLTRPPQYVGFKQATSRFDWAWMQANKADYFADLERAESDANTSVDQGKAHFISKQSKKLDTATKNYKGRGRIKISGELRFRVLIEGHLDVQFAADSRFRLAMSMIVNYRYKSGFKSFYQFPARFQGVVIRGVKLDKPSEARMAELFI